MHGIRHKPHCLRTGLPHLPALMAEKKAQNNLITVAKYFTWGVLPAKEAFFCQA